MQYAVDPILPQWRLLVVSGVTLLRAAPHKCVEIATMEPTREERDDE
jgi:hypothetical protein